jgi:cytochrome d ubiquinol oxidase subunit II
MSPDEIAGAVAVLAIVAYTAFGGADFGGGIWTLLASGPRKEDQRNALERAIGPVWETNHVWLILLVVTLFVVFPTAYAAIFTALYVPLFLALVGIVARGAAFAFRHYSDRTSRLSHISLRAFSMASVLTPFVFGLCIGAVTGGHLRVDGPNVLSGAFAGWLSPFAIMAGLIGLLLCAFLGAAYMVPRTEGSLRDDFRRRALGASLALGVVTTVAIPVAGQDAAEFYGRLGRASVVGGIGITAILGLGTLFAIWRGAVRSAPFLAATTASGVIVTWALAQRPNLIIPGLGLEAAAAPDFTVKSFLVALPIGALILIPSLVLLYNTFSRDVYQPDSPGH